ncbi:MAG: D-amino-acid transaminase [Hyphomonadaceae bacterium]|nr:D-amino-acid transaminase [Hyphomonadaceae bacterium]
MTALAYVNGRYVPLGGATVSVQDRGFQFGDAVYEVWAVRDGRLCDMDEHLARLHRSLGELQMHAPMPDMALRAVLGETRRRNRVRNGLVYLQISRGAAARDHAFPPENTRPTVVVTAKSLDWRQQQQRASKGVGVISMPDIRWGRRDIKSTNLLPNVLARQAAKERGGFEAWLVDPDGNVTEGTASNAWIVDKTGAIRTRPLSNDILHGVTRAVLLRLARERRMEIVESPFTVGEALAAREAFITGATNPVVAVVAIDGRPIGDGAPGPVTQKLRDLYLQAGA